MVWATLSMFLHEDATHSTTLSRGKTVVFEVFDLNGKDAHLHKHHAEKAYRDMTVRLQVL
jgi:hypothetical protein